MMMKFNIKLAIPGALLLLSGCQAGDGNSSDATPAIEESRDFYFSVTAEEGSPQSVYIGHVASPSDICERLSHPIFQSPYFEASEGSDQRPLYQLGGQANIIIEWIMRRGEFPLRAQSELSISTTNKIMDNLETCLKEIHQKDYNRFSNIEHWLQFPDNNLDLPCFQISYEDEEIINDSGDFVSRKIVDPNYRRCAQESLDIQFYTSIGSYGNRLAYPYGHPIMLLLGLREGGGLFTNLLDRAMPDT